MATTAFTGSTSNSAATGPDVRDPLATLSYFFDEAGLSNFDLNNSRLVYIDQDIDPALIGWTTTDTYKPATETLGPNDEVIASKQSNKLKYTSSDQLSTFTVTQNINSSNKQGVGSYTNSNSRIDSVAFKGANGETLNESISESNSFTDSFKENTDQTITSGSFTNKSSGSDAFTYTEGGNTRDVKTDDIKVSMSDKWSESSKSTQSSNLNTGVDLTAYDSIETDSTTFSYSDGNGYKASLGASDKIVAKSKTDSSNPDKDIAYNEKEDFKANFSYADALGNSLKLTAAATSKYEGLDQYSVDPTPVSSSVTLSGVTLKTSDYQIGLTKMTVADILPQDIIPVLTAANVTTLFSSIKAPLRAFILNGDNKITVTKASGLQVDGGAGKDVIIGGTGDDVIAGGLGNDTLTGGKGADKFLFKAEIAVNDLGKPLNVDTITDFITATMAAADTSKTADKIYMDGTLFVNQSFVSQDKLANVAAGVTGIIYETSTGKLYYADGTSALATDAIQFAQLKTKPASLALADFSFEGAGFSSGGDDILQGTDSPDELDGMEGDDTIDGGAGDDILAGGTGNDNVSGGIGNDTVLGGTGFDTVLGGAGDDTLDGDEDDDNVDGGDGNDTVSGGFGIDTLSGGAGIDTIDGGDDDDSLDGGTGDDTLTGGTGDDTLLGGAGNDTLDGEADQDLLKGGTGNDTLTGGTGLDIFEFEEAGDTNFDQITDFTSGDDSINISTTLATTYIAGADLTADFVSGTGTVAAVDASDHFLYDATTGSLYYDADGNGATAKVLIAVLQGTPLLNASDLNIV